MDVVYNFGHTDYDFSLLIRILIPPELQHQDLVQLMFVEVYFVMLCQLRLARITASCTPPQGGVSVDGECVQIAVELFRCVVLVLYCEIRRLISDIVRDMTVLFVNVVLRTLT